MFNGASVLGSVPVNGRSTKGLPVASMVKNIEDNGWTKSYTWYDDKARPVATESRNHLGGIRGQIRYWLSQEYPPVQQPIIKGMLHRGKW